MSNIEWTDCTWNPVVGCTPVSPGCLNCYAATMAVRLEAIGRPEYQPVTMSPKMRSDIGIRDSSKMTRDVRIAEFRNGRSVFTGSVRAVVARLHDPLHWRKPRMVFVNSMSDLFHEAVPFEFIDKVFAVMAMARQHTFQVLTKRPERMAEYLNDSSLSVGEKGQLAAGVFERIACAANAMIDDDDERQRIEIGWPLPNVFVGTSVENQTTADERIPHLLRCPAAVRFLSVEPLLGLVDITRIHANGEGASINGGRVKPVFRSAFNHRAWYGVAVPDAPGDFKNIDRSLRAHFGSDQPLHWVIVGGESGHHARPCDVAWIRSIVEQCKTAKVPCFVKQLGAFPVCENEVGSAKGGGHVPMSLRNRKGGDPSEWPEDLRVRQWPEVVR